jgi:hypothetical protein
MELIQLLSVEEWGTGDKGFSSVASLEVIAHKLHTKPFHNCDT